MMKPRPLALTAQDLAKLAKTGACTFREKLFWQPRRDLDGNMTIYDNNGSWVSSEVVRRDKKTGKEIVLPGNVKHLLLEYGTPRRQVGDVCQIRKSKSFAEITAVRVREVKGVWWYVLTLKAGK